MAQVQTEKNINVFINIFNSHDQLTIYFRLILIYKNDRFCSMFQRRSMGILTLHSKR